jgi:hypothetical protein
MPSFKMAGHQWSSQELVRKRTKQAVYSIKGFVEILERDGTFDEIVKVRGIAGITRLIIRSRGLIPEAWAMALLFNQERVDGIDWEHVVRDHRGAKFNCKGWHRHIWKPGSLDRNKECLPKFSPLSREDFLLAGFQVLKVKSGRRLRDDRQMRLDQAGIS